MEKKTIKSRGIETGNKLLDDVQNGFENWSTKNTEAIVNKLMDKVLESLVSKTTEFYHEHWGTKKTISENEFKKVIEEVVAQAYHDGFEQGLVMLKKEDFAKFSRVIKQDSYMQYLVALQQYGMTYDDSVEILNSATMIWEEDFKLTGRKRKSWEIFETKQLEFDKRDGTQNLKKINQLLENAKQERTQKRKNTGSNESDQ